MSLSEHAGRRDRRITIQQIKSDATLTDSGHVDETNEDNWAGVASRWAELHTQKAPFGSREYNRGDQMAAEVSHLVKVLFDADLWEKVGVANASKFRLILESSGRNRILNLTSPPVNDNEADEYISFMCKEVR